MNPTNENYQKIVKVNLHQVCIKVFGVHFLKDVCANCLSTNSYCPRNSCHNAMPHYVWECKRRKKSKHIQSWILPRLNPLGLLVTPMFCLVDWFLCQFSALSEKNEKKNCCKRMDCFMFFCLCTNKLFHIAAMQGFQMLFIKVKLTWKEGTCSSVFVTGQNIIKFRPFFFNIARLSLIELGFFFSINCLKRDFLYGVWLKQYIKKR